MLVDRAGLGVPSVATGGRVSFTLASTSTSFLLAGVSVVSDVERATLSCWRTVVLLAAARARLSRAVSRRSMVVAGAEITAWALPTGPPPDA